jgi:hypothetical protein
MPFSSTSTTMEVINENDKQLSEISSNTCISTSSSPIILSKRTHDNDEPESQRLSFNKWLHLKRDTSERKRFILIDDEYTVLLKVLHDRTLLRSCKDLKWAYNMISKRKLSVVLLETETGYQDTIITPKDDKDILLPNSVPYLKLATISKFESIINDAHQKGSHCGIIATFDLIKNEYYGISRDIVAEFISRCKVCQDTLAHPTKNISH